MTSGLRRRRERVKLNKKPKPTKSSRRKSIPDRDKSDSDKRPTPTGEHTIRSAGVIRTRKRRTGGEHAAKSKKRVRGILVACLAAAFTGAVVAWQLSLPTGIIEALQNFFALHSADGSGLDSVMGHDGVQLSARFNRTELLSGSYYEVFNKQGGAVLSAQHGFSDPAMALSEARTLIYDRGGSDCDIYNARRKLRHFTVDGTLYTAAIARDGAVAVAYKSNDYLSAVEVYSKRGKLLFEKNLASEYATALALSANGRYLTAATLRASGGVFLTELYCFDVSSGDTLSQNTYDGTILNAAERTAGNIALVAGGDGAYFVSMKDGAAKKADLDGKIAFYSVAKRGTSAFVCNRQTNVYDNKIRVFDREGAEITAFDFTGAIDGFSITDADIYVLSDNELHRYRVSDLNHSSTAVPGAKSMAAFKDGAVAYTGGKLIIPKFD